MGAPGRAAATTTTTTTGVSAVSATAKRLKREDFRRTKHDSAFSKWQILIGPLDWENYDLGKEGAERYRVGNLPTVCGPGLYEIGVAVNRSGSGRDVGKLEPERIVVVYLGQADNVRSRLQHYGRSGSHLVRHRCSVVPESTGDGYRTGFFTEIFSRGYPIVYRWAPMKSKNDAEQMEAKLLEKFDYAWNKVGNGARRPNAALNKIEKISTKTSNIPKILKMLQALSDQKVGIPIKPGKPTLSNNESNNDLQDSSFNFFGRVFKFVRSQPRLVPHDPDVFIKESNPNSICGLALGDGLICTKPPVEGRKRCIEHKGRRLMKNAITKTNKASLQENVVDNLCLICGVLQNNGSSCERPPYPGRKRCEVHKGMRINQIMSKSSSLDSTFIVDVSLNFDNGNYCGVHLGDGKCCERLPVKGRKRCEEHKGVRVDACIAKLLTRN